MTNYILITAGIILLGALLYLIFTNLAYRSDNVGLRKSLSQCRASMRVERANRASRIRTLEQKLSQIDLAMVETDIKKQEIQVLKQEIQVLKVSETYDLNEPQYRDLKSDYLEMMSRQQLLKDATRYITTEVEEIRPKVFKYSHSLIIFENIN